MGKVTVVVVSGVVRFQWTTQVGKVVSGVVIKVSSFM